MFGFNMASLADGTLETELETPLWREVAGVLALSYLWFFTWAWYVCQP